MQISDSMIGAAWDGCKEILTNVNYAKLHLEFVDQLKTECYRLDTDFAGR